VSNGTAPNSAVITLDGATENVLKIMMMLKSICTKNVCFNVQKNVMLDVFTKGKESW
jgi:hypothetical protein